MAGGEPQREAGGFRMESEREVYSGRVFSVAVGTFRAPDGSIFDRDLVHHLGAVGIVPLLEDGTVVLVRQYRAPVDRELLEIPAGLCDVDGEPPEVTARRELVEEVGLRAGALDLLTRFHNSPGFADEAVRVYLATDLSTAVQDLQGPEEQHMTVERMPLDEAMRLVGTGAITDAKTLIGLSLTLRKLGR